MIPFPKSVIKEGLYTSGKEFQTDDGKDYIGLYHKYPDGTVFTGASYDKLSSKKLYKFQEKTVTSFYDTLNKKPEVKSIKKYKDPKPYYPNPTDEDYNKGYINRFFIQKANTNGPAIEVDEKSFQSLTDKTAGINGYLYKGIQFKWVIQKLTIKDDIARKRRLNEILHLNLDTINRVSLVLNGVKDAIRYFTQFTF